MWKKEEMAALINKLHPPKRCPNCGSSAIEFVIGENNHGSAIYDTYCEDCTWSGDISPDSDLRVYRGSASSQTLATKVNP